MTPEERAEALRKKAVKKAKIAGCSPEYESSPLVDFAQGAIDRIADSAIIPKKRGRKSKQ